MLVPENSHIFEENLAKMLKMGYNYSSKADFRLQKFSNGVIMIYQPLNANGVDYSAGIIRNFSSYPLHRHIAIELMYVITGELSVLIDGQSHKAGSGELIFVGSRLSHLVSACREGTVFLLIEFGPIFTNNRFEGIAALAPSRPILTLNTHPEMGAILPLFDEIIAERGTPTDESELIVAGNISKAAAYLCRALAPKESEAPQETPAPKCRMSAEQVLDFITYHYMEALTVKDVADRMGYSVCSFCRIVKKEFGKSFHVLLNEKRIKRACALLYDTELPIGEIARQVGFSEAKSFCRVFKSIKGCTPSEYAARKKQK